MQERNALIVEFCMQKVTTLIPKDCGLNFACEVDAHRDQTAARTLSASSRNGFNESGLLIASRLTDFESSYP